MSFHLYTETMVKNVTCIAKNLNLVLMIQFDENVNGDVVFRDEIQNLRLVQGWSRGQLEHWVNCNAEVKKGISRALDIPQK